MRKKVLVAQETFLQPGGAIRLGLTLIDELLRKGYDVSYALLYSVKLQELSRRYFNRPCPEIPVYSLFRGSYPIATFHRLFLWVPMMKAIRKQDPQIVFVDHASFRPLRRCLKGRKLVHYVHFPPFSRRLMKRFPHIYDESSAEDYKRFPFNIYWRGYMSLQELVAIDEDFADTICANSRFTANAVKGIWNRDAIVVYPPVAVNDFSHGQKQKMVVSLGRIDPDKRLEDLIKALALCATKPKLVIVGGLVSNYVPYVVRLQNLIKQLNLERRVSIKPNASFDVVKKILSSAKVYVHAKHFEHFGISVVEAMASGCVPIVHRSGGPYLDIIENDKYGFSYATISELSQKIDSLMSSDTSALEERCVCRSKHFSEDKFRERIVEVIGD